MLLRDPCARPRVRGQSATVVAWFCDCVLPRCPLPRSLVGNAYPAYATYKSVVKKQTELHPRLLMYWWVDTFCPKPRPIPLPLLSPSPGH